MSVQSTNKSIIVPAQGDFPGTWGTQYSSNGIVITDNCFGAQTAITLTSADHTVSTTETQSPIHDLSGTLTTDVSVIYPAAAGGYYIISNLTTGAHLVTASLSGGTGVVIPQTAVSFVKADPSHTGVGFASAPHVLTTQGDLLSRDANTYKRLAVGSNHQVLKSNGTDPSWGAVTLTTDVTGTLPIANGGTANTTANAAFLALAAGSNWATFTPVVASLGGDLTSVSATGRWAEVNKVIFFSITITIVTNGPGSGWILVFTPTGMAGLNNFSGRESIGGKMLQGFAISSAELGVAIYDNTYPGADGAVLTMCGSYERS
jgi:hypothetical protein